MMRLHYSSDFNGVVGIVALHQVNPFVSVREWDSQFLGLFPHRYDYIWAVHPNPGAKPEWQTETRHPLADRTIQQGSQLYGVRFGTETSYAMLDIDIGSRYHPRQDPFGVDRLLLALEPLGLISNLTIESQWRSAPLFSLRAGPDQLEDCFSDFHTVGKCRIQTLSRPTRNFPQPQALCDRW
jgi:hypothetical protein